MRSTIGHVKNIHRGGGCLTPACPPPEVAGRQGDQAVGNCLVEVDPLPVEGHGHRVTGLALPLDSAFGHEDGAGDMPGAVGLEDDRVSDLDLLEEGLEEHRLRVRVIPDPDHVLLRFIFEILGEEQSSLGTCPQQFDGTGLGR